MYGEKPGFVDSLGCVDFLLEVSFPQLGDAEMDMTHSELDQLASASNALVLDFL